MRPKCKRNKWLRHTVTWNTAVTIINTQQRSTNWKVYMFVWSLSTVFNCYSASLKTEVLQIERKCGHKISRLSKNPFFLGGGGGGGGGAGRGGRPPDWQLYRGGNFELQIYFYYTDSERGNPLPPYGLLFPFNSKGSFICTIPQTG